MKIRILGKTNLKVNSIGMGCWAIGGPFYHKGGKIISYGQVNDNESIKALEKGIELGVNLFDTANNYGAAARVLGMVPTGSYNAGIEEMGTSRAQMYEHHLKHALKMIREGKLKAGRDQGVFDRVVVGSQYDDDGYTKQPLFTRDMHDNPGARELVEDE